MEALVDLLKKQHLTIGSVESLTGGLFASKLTNISGVSDIYLGSIVSYANVIKHDILDISEDIIDKYGVISEEIAYLMAKHGSNLLRTDITVAFTGNAGPLAMEDKPVGLVYVCIKYHNQYYHFKDNLSGKRNEIREEIVNLAVARLIDLLKEKGEE